MSDGATVKAVVKSGALALVEQDYSSSLLQQDEAATLFPRDAIAAPIKATWAAGHVRSSAGRRPGGFETSHNPVTNSNGNKRAKSFYDLFYNRIHFDPATLALGQLLNSETRYINVWNGYFEPRTLLSIAESDGEGVELRVGETPQMFAPLQQKTYEVGVSLEGPPSIDASYQMEWDNQVTRYRITGDRLVVFAFAPNTTADFTERFSWYGTIFKAYSGKEQRMDLSGGPKVSYSYQVQLLDEEVQRWESMMWGWQNRTFAVPIWNSYAYTSQRIGTGATTVDVTSTEYREFLAGGLAVIWAGPELFETVQIEEVGPTYLRLKKPTQKSWTKRVHVIPLRIMRMAREIQYTGEVANFRNVSASFSADAVEEVPAMAWATTYQGFPVLDFSPDMSGNLSGSWERNADWTDGEYSLPLVVDRSGLGTPRFTWQFTFASKREIWQFKALLATLAGTVGQFWSSSWSPDMYILAEIKQGSNSFFVREAFNATMFSNSKGRDTIEIVLRNGTIYRRKILARGASDGQVKGSEVITIDEALPVRILPQQVLRVSYLTLSRFENEAFEMLWKTEDFVTMSAQLKGLTDGV